MNAVGLGGFDIEFYRRNKRILDRFALSAVFIAFVYLFVKVVFKWVSPFAIGLLFAVLFEPAVARLNRRFKLGRGLLAFMCILTLMFIFGVLGMVIATRIAGEAIAFVEAVPLQLDNLRHEFSRLSYNYASIIEFVPEELRSTADSISGSMLSAVTSSATAFVRRFSTSVVRFVPGTLLGLILCFISMFFFIKDREVIARMLVRNSPPAFIDGYETIRRGLFGALGGYIRAQLMLMLVSACICVTSLSIMRYPFALFMGLLTAFFDFLPVFGPGFVLWPWALISALSGNFSMGIGLMLIYFVVIVTRQVLEPKVLGSQIGVHPLLTLMSMFVGLNVFGALGFFIGPFIVISLKALYEAETGGDTSGQ